MSMTTVATFFLPQLQGLPDEAMGTPPHRRRKQHWDDDLMILMWEKHINVDKTMPWSSPSPSQALVITMVAMVNSIPVYMVVYCLCGKYTRIY